MPASSKVCKIDSSPQNVLTLHASYQKEQLLEFFTSILGLEAIESSDAVGSPEPIYAFKFSNGASLSVELTEVALSDQQAQRGTWLELRTDDALGLQQRVQAFGLPRVVHPYTPFFYIQAPGGQVFRIVSSKECPLATLHLSG